MTIPESDESIFEQALRADLPSAEQEARLRRRMLMAGITAGSALAASSAAASAPVGLVGQLAAKVAALSWPATLVLTTAVATPIVALPVWLGPKFDGRANALAHASASRANAAGSSVAAARSNAALEPAHVASPEPALADDVQALPAEPKAVVAPSSANARTSSQASSGDQIERRAPASLASSAEASPAAEPEPANSAASAHNASTLRAETELLDRTFTELRAGHRAAAAALITEHEQRFPNGLLRQERERARARLESNLKGE